VEELPPLNSKSCDESPSTSFNLFDQIGRLIIFLTPPTLRGIEPVFLRNDLILLCYMSR